MEASLRPESHCAAASSRAVGDDLIVDRLVEAEESDRFCGVAGEIQIVDGDDSADRFVVGVGDERARSSGGCDGGRRVDEDTIEIDGLVG